MTIPVNPYVAGNPVGDSPAFVRRADVLREVLRVLRRSQDNAIVLYGQRRIGKASIPRNTMTRGATLRVYFWRRLG
jgi:AAA+ ATPase superfamily predicted ATPase